MGAEVAAAIDRRLRLEQELARMVPALLEAEGTDMERRVVEVFADFAGDPGRRLHPAVPGAPFTSIQGCRTEGLPQRVRLLGPVRLGGRSGEAPLDLTEMAVSQRLTARRAGRPAVGSVVDSAIDRVELCTGIAGAVRHVA